MARLNVNWTVKKHSYVIQSITITGANRQEARKKQKLKPSVLSSDGRSSNSSSISTSAVLNIIERLKRNRIRSTTQNTYYRVWKSFNEFIIRLDVKPNNWEDRITLFVGYLVDSNRKSSTIKSYVSAIKSVLHEDGVELNKNKYLLNALTNTCKLINDKVRTRLPIQLGVLELILKFFKLNLT